MTYATDTAPSASPASWLGKTEAWLDARGKGAWIAAMVLGFILFWPLGLALLFYMIWSKQMFKGSCAHKRTHWQHGRTRHFHSSGNAAFDAYKDETLARLEREQEEFESFLRRLREAKDKAEFDQFMDERARKARDAGSDEGETGNQAQPA